MAAATQAAQAARQGDAATLRALLDANRSLVDQRCAWVELSLLHEAAVGGSVECVRLALAAGARSALSPHLLKLPLHLARRPDVARLLLQPSDSAIYSAIVEGDVPMLARQSADSLECADAPQRFRPLHLAAGLGQAACVAALLRAGVSVDPRTVCSETPLHVACAAGHAPCCELLLRGGADREARDRWEWTPLFSAAHKGHNDCVELLLRDGASAFAATTGGSTPLHIAAQSGQAACVRALLRGGASVHARGADQDTPLHLATRSAECVRALLQEGADLAARNSDGRTPLHVAVEEMALASVSLLLEAGARPDVACGRGETALHVAAQSRSATILPTLLLRAAATGMDLNPYCRAGMTPLHRAVCARNLEGVALLLQAGASPNAPVVPAQQRPTYATLPLGCSALGIAAGMLFAAAVPLLLAAGADPTVRCEDGRTPADLASKSLDLRDALLRAESATRATAALAGCAQRESQLGGAKFARHAFYDPRLWRMVFRYFS